MTRIDQQTLVQQAELLKAMAHPTRLCILHRLVAKGECNVSHMQECLEKPQSTVSQHLAKLRSAGVVTATRYGTEVHYSVTEPLVRKLIAVLSE